MTRYLIPIVFFGLLIVVFTIGLDRDPTFVPSPLIGKTAPAFELPLLSDPTRQVSDADLRGQVTLLNVWATWCVGCRQEHDTLMRLAATQPVPIYGLNYRDDRDDARVWLQRLGDPYEATGFDPDGSAGLDWGVYGAPETFLIDPAGIVVYKHLGPLSLGIWNDEFVPRIEAMTGSGT